MKKYLWFGAVLCLLLAGCRGGEQSAGTPPPAPTPTPMVSSAPSAAPEATPAPVETEPPYVSPIDFDALWQENTDIYAWLSIPDTAIDYPLFQHGEDDEYYLRRDIHQKSDRKGSLFTQHTYNGTDMNDAVTVVYGHNSKGAAFETLQATYSSSEKMEAHREIIVYLPDGEYHYRVFAAVPYSNAHILYYHNFRLWSVYQEFLDEILSTRTMGSCVDPEAEVDPTHRILILSTCLKGNSKKRFLILATRED